MFSVMFSANAVLPIEGRAARITISPFCRPLSISSSSSKPVGTPVTCLPSLRSSVRMVSSRMSRSEDAARASRRCAIAKIRASASPSVSTGSWRDWCASTRISPAARISSRSVAFSRTMRAYSGALAAVATPSARSIRYAEPPTSSSTPWSFRRCTSETISTVAVES